MKLMGVHRPQHWQISSKGECDMSKKIVILNGIMTGMLRSRRKRSSGIVFVNRGMMLNRRRERIRFSIM